MTARSPTGKGKPMRPDVALAFDRMAAAAREEAALTLLVTSGYRSDAEQARLFAAQPAPQLFPRRGAASAAAVKVRRPSERGPAVAQTISSIMTSKVSRTGSAEASPVSAACARAARPSGSLASMSSSLSQ